MIILKGAERVALNTEFKLKNISQIEGKVRSYIFKTKEDIIELGNSVYVHGFLDHFCCTIKRKSGETIETTIDAEVFFENINYYKEPDSDVWVKTIDLIDISFGEAFDLLKIKNPKSLVFLKYRVGNQKKLIGITENKNHNFDLSDKVIISRDNVDQEVKELYALELRGIQFYADYNEPSVKHLFRKRNTL